MGQPRSPEPVKIILGMFSVHRELFEQVCRELVPHWGEVDITSELFPFEHTDYYQQEMGKHLLRRFVSFKPLIDSTCLPDYKHFSNLIEKRFAKRNKRRINLDPGYLNFYQLVLASTKNFAHRIYIGKGIFAELTLQYKKGTGWKDLPWTYPDYRDTATKDFFIQVRRRYQRQLNNNS